MDEIDSIGSTRLEGGSGGWYNVTLLYFYLQRCLHSPFIVYIHAVSQIQCFEAVETGKDIRTYGRLAFAVVGPTVSNSPSNDLHDLDLNIARFWLPAENS